MSLSSSATAAANPWLLVLESLEKKINKHSYDTWLKPTRFSHAKGKVLFISVPNAEFKLIGEKYADLISEALENLNLDYSDVEFVTEEAPPVNVRHDGGFGPVSSHGASRGNGAAVAPGKQARFDWDSAALLNQKYKFDDFVIGSGNQFAHAAAQAVAERPSKAYNPLFMYGGVGLGKNHLMHAIGHEIKRRNHNLPLTYISTEKFTNETINAIRYGKMESLRERYRNNDILLIDDIQFIAGKERTQ